jgi:PAS domain S-box-containing protein
MSGKTREKKARPTVKKHKLTTRRSSQFHGIHDEVSKALAEHGLKPGRLLQAISDIAACRIGDACVIRLFREKEFRLVAAAVAHPDPTRRNLLRNLNKKVRFSADSGISGTVFVRDEAILSSSVPKQLNITGIPRDFKPYVERYGITSIMGAPLRISENVIGTMLLSRDRGSPPYRREDLALLRTLADRTSLAYANAVLHEKLEKELVRRGEAEKSLRKTSDILETIFSSIHPMIALLDRDFKFVRVNRAYAETDGRPPEFYVGKSHFDLFPNAENEAIFNEVVRSGEAYHVFEKPFEYRNSPESGTSYLDWSLVPVKDEGGGVEMLVLCLIDVTRRRKAQEASLRLGAAAESMADAIIITDERGYIQYVNPGFEALTGYARHEALGRDIHMLDSGRHDEAFFRKVRAAVKNRGSWRGRLTSRKKDGALYEEECTITVVRDPVRGVLNHVIIKRDITERLRLESIAEAANLMSNIGYVFAGIRHEIGNPINSAKMALSVLSRNLERYDHGRMRDYIRRGMDELSKVEYLLHTLKSFNMYEKPEIQPLIVKPFLAKFVRLVESDIRKKGIRIRASVHPEKTACLADPRAMQQVMLNLITNAADACAGRKDSEIAVDVKGHTGIVVLEVRDNGRGMSPEQQQNIFRPFFTTKEGGSGLGLIIVKSMLTGMNGSIEVTSSLGKGTVVRATLPAAVPAAGTGRRRGGRSGRTSSN